MNILEKVVKPYVQVTNDRCVLEEYLLDIRAEPSQVTEFYLKQAARIASKFDDEELAESLEQSYTDLHFGKNNREMDSLANNLME